MTLPFTAPLKPMLAASVRDIPAPASVDGGLSYEPKWDGFRCLVFRDTDAVTLQSRDGRDLARYFPEVVALVTEQVAPGTVLDGEIVIARGAGLDFDALLQRIHPAASRVTRLAEETPASYVAFDLLAAAGVDVRETPFGDRRRLLETALADARPPLFVTPSTTDPAVAQEWFAVFEGAGLDGVMAKPLAAGYAPNKRTLFKIKHARTADCVVAGYRMHSSGDGVGSLLLGLYENAEPGAALQSVGVAASFAAPRRRELLEELAPYRVDDLAGHPWADWAAPEGAAGRLPGGQSRWNTGKDLSWEPLRPELVAEVSYDHMQGDRFRHTTHLLRWRPDRTAASCTYAQLERPVRFDLAAVLGA